MLPRWCLLAVLGSTATTSTAHADESEALAAEVAPRPGSLELSSSLRVTAGHVEWYWETGVLSENQGTALGFELRGRYWLKELVSVELELGRPRIVDRLGHAGDWNTDRARLQARYNLRGTGTGYYADLRGVVGVTVPIEELTSVPDTLGIGGTAALAVGVPELELFGFATIGRPGTTGIHASVGAGLSARPKFLTITGSVHAGQALAHSTAEEHILLGGEVTLARGLADRWLAYVTLGAMYTPRTYPVEDRVSARQRVATIGIGLQRRFGGAPSTPRVRHPLQLHPWVRAPARVPMHHDACRDGGDVETAPASQVGDLNG